MGTSELSGVIMVFAAVGVVAALFVYMLPALIAANRAHHNTMAITLVTILLGWSFIGWIAALIWSLTDAQPRSRLPII